jgi:hypothetical protein
MNEDYTKLKDFAQKRLDDSCENSNEYDARYWVGYIDGLNVLCKKLCRIEEEEALKLLEHGVIALPCKVGDMVYRITRCSCEDIDGAHTECEFYGFGTDDKICELPNDMKCPYKFRVAGCNVTEMNIFMFAKEWESTTFPIREEAERALKDREKYD